MLAAALTAAIVIRTVLLTVSEPSLSNVLWVLACLVVGGIPALSGWWTSRHQPDGFLGCLLVLPGLQAALMILAIVTAAVETVRVPTNDYLVAASQGTWIFIYVVIALPLLFFPDGHLGTRSARTLFALILGDAVVFVAVAAVAPGPFLAPDELAPHVFGTLPAQIADILTGVSLALLPTTLIALFVTLARRRHAAVGPRRRQYGWLALGAALVWLTMLATWASYVLTGNADLVLVVGLGTTYTLLPLLIATAVVRPDLFDPDRLLTTATVHLAVSALLLAVFTGVTTLAGLVLVRGAPEIAVAATALCALGIAPVRARLQQSVDRRLYPARQAAYAAISGLQADTLTGAAQPEQLEDRLRHALHDDTLSIRYLSPFAGALVDAQGEVVPQPSTDRHTGVWLGTQQIGTLSTDAQISPELLRDIAVRATPVVEMVRVRVDLRRALHEADESRARLLSVGYDERAKLERDLHDGAQQRLVALGMALRLAQRHLDRGIDVSGVLDAAVTEIATSVSELRQVAHGIRPSCLDDGLEHALASLVASAPIPISVKVEVLGLDKNIETTAYYVASEAITNAIKHSGASHIALHVAASHGELHVSVADDGEGVPTGATGAGLAGLQDRVGAQGGRFAIRSDEGKGTIIEAVLPCG